MNRIPASAALLILLGCGGEEPCDDWFCENGGATTDSKGGTGKTGTKTDGTKTGEGAYLAMSGELSASSGLGIVFLTGTGCESTADVVGAVAVPDCSGCDFAWVIDFGALNDDPAPCADAEAYVADPLGLGHADPAELWFDKGGWAAVDGGVSDVSGDDWTWGFDK